MQINKIKSFLFAFSIVTFYLADGQDQKDFKCALLNTAIETKVFLTHFYVCEFDDELTIIDTSRYFKGCDLMKKCNTNLLLSNQADSLKAKSSIVLYKIENIGNIYRLYFYRPRSGITLTLKFKKKKRKFKLLGHDLGAI